MTVANNTTRNQYSATSGQTVFPYTFEIFSKDDIVVLKNGVTLSEGTNYTVSGVGAENGGNVTLTIGATSGDLITVYRDMALERTTDYQTSGDFLAQDVNNDFDRLWLASQQIKDSIDRVITIPEGDSPSVNLELPATADRAGKVLSFDSGGNVTVTTSSGGGGGASDASAVTYTPGGSGAVETTVQTKLREFVSVKDFGATGNGTTDDTAFISAALNSGATTVYFPSGTYKITARIFCNVSNNLTVIGDGAKIDMDAVEIYEMLRFFVTAPIDILHVEGLHLDGNGWAQMGIYVDCNAQATQLVTIENNFCEYFDNLTVSGSTYGIRVDALGAESVRVVGNRVYNVTRTVPVGVGVNSSVGIGIFELVHGIVISQNHIENIGSYVGAADADGMQVWAYNKGLTQHQTAAPRIVENYFYNCKGRFIKLQCANAIVSNNRFEINNMETVDGFIYVDYQQGGGICSDNTAFHNPAVGYGQSARFFSCSLRSNDIHENVYICSNNSVILEGDMYCFAFVFQDGEGVSNGAVKISDNIVSDRFDTYNVEYFTVLGLDNNITFMDLTISNNQLGYLGSTGALFSFYGPSLADLVHPVIGPSIANKLKLSLMNNSVRTAGAGIDLIDTQLSGGLPPFLKNLMIRGNANFTDSQVLAQGMDVQTLPQGTTFYYGTDGSTGGLINAPVGFDRYMIVEKISHNFCRITALNSVTSGGVPTHRVAMFRTDTLDGYRYESTTALTF